MILVKKKNSQFMIEHETCKKGVAIFLFPLGLEPRCVVLKESTARIVWLVAVKRIDANVGFKKKLMCLVHKHLAHNSPSFLSVL